MPDLEGPKQYVSRHYFDVNAPLVRKHIIEKAIIKADEAVEVYRSHMLELEHG